MTKILKDDLERLHAEQPELVTAIVMLARDLFLMEKNVLTNRRFHPPLDAYTVHELREVARIDLPEDIEMRAGKNPRRHMGYPEADIGRECVCGRGKLSSDAVCTTCLNQEPSPRVIETAVGVVMPISDERGVSIETDPDLGPSLGPELEKEVAKMIDNDIRTMAEVADRIGFTAGSGSNEIPEDEA